MEEMSGTTKAKFSYFHMDRLSCLPRTCVRKKKSYFEFTASLAVNDGGISMNRLKRTVTVALFEVIDWQR